MSHRSVTSLFLVACLASACQPGDTPMDAWVGTWQAAEPLFLDPAADPVYETIHDLRPEYSAEEIEALFISTADVDYTTLRVEPSTLTFVDGDTVVCEGRYAARDPDAVAPPASPETYVDFLLVEQVDGDCGAYDTVSVTALLPEGPEVHFHIVTSSATGRLHPPPWNPSVWTTTTTPEFFAAELEASATVIASSLPPR